MKQRLFLFVVPFWVLSVIATVAKAGWTLTGEMKYGTRIDHTATLLPDGRVLVAGGRSGYGVNDWLKSAEVYDPASDTWAEYPMTLVQEWHTATALQDGRVMVVGSAGCEIFNPETNGWAEAASANRSRHGAALLSDGRVMVVAGSGTSQTSVVYDPETDAWIDGPVFPGGEAGTRGLALYCLENGEIVAFNSQLEVLRYLPGAYNWSREPTDANGEPYSSGRMRGGRFLLSSGSSTSGRSSTIYDAALHQFIPTGEMNVQRGYHRKTLLGDGRVLASAGNTLGTILSSCEIYDPVLGQWNVAESMRLARTRHVAVVLADGRVLVAGGMAEAGLSAELYSYPPSIEVQPSDVTGLAGRTVTLSVLAHGGGALSYQWRKGEMDIPEANGASLELADLHASDAASYTVVVSNADGNVTSDPAGVTVVPDADGDGLSDAEETDTYHTDPNNPDTDGDGLFDQTEVAVLGTDPLLADTDGDGYLDAYEIQTGKSPLDPDDKPSLMAEIWPAVEFSFPSAVGSSYRVEGSPDLVDWSTVEDGIIGTGAGITRFYSTRTLKVRFFRVEEATQP